MLAFADMRTHNWQYLICLALSVFCSFAWGADLQVRVQPANNDLRDNVINHIGDLGDRSERELIRYRPIAVGQAERALQALGYYQSEIEAEVRGGETPRLILRIRSGPPVRLGSVNVRVQGPAAQQPEFTVPRDLRRGNILHHGRYEDTKQSILNQASRYGYFSGQFTRQRLEVDPAAGVANVELIFESGPRYRLGDVAFEGDAPFDEDLLRRMVTLERGQLYDAEQIAEQNQALQGSGYFSGVRVVANPAMAEQEIIPVVVNLTARRPRTLGLGPGYSTDVGPRLRFEWIRHWVNPQGHRYGAEAEVAAPRQNLAFWYEIPRDPPLTDKLRFAGGYQYEEIAGTDSISRLFTVGPEWHRQLPNGWDRIYSLKLQHEQYDLGDDSGTSTLLMPGVAYSYLQSDSRVDPSRGYRLGFALSAAKEGLVSDADLIHGDANLRGLITLWDRHRFLGRLQVGANLSGEYQAVPPSLRYFAGGDQSVRGYSYQSLSPTNAAGDRVGGRYQFATSAEYQYSLTDRWRIATFIDQGNAFDSLDFPTLKSSVGLGVRWVSPVGPIRVDLAHALDGEGGIRLHFTVGPEL